MSAILKIDRSRPFDPSSFTGLGKDWSITKQDERSLNLSELDLSSICLETCLKDKELRIDGDERSKRLKGLGCIRLDIKFFQTFWEDQHLIPESYKEKINGRTMFIFFEGTELCGPDDRSYHVCFFWSGIQWWWSHARVEGAKGFNDPSAILLADALGALSSSVV